MNRFRFRIGTVLLFSVSLFSVSILRAAELTPKQLADRAHSAFDAGQLGDGFKLLQSAQTGGPTIDALIVEADASLKLGYPRLAFHDLDEAEKLAPGDARIAPLRAKLAPALQADTSVEKSPSDLLGPSLQALESGDSAKAETELVRAFFAARCFDTSMTFAMLVAFRADELVSKEKIPTAISDYRRSLTFAPDPKRGLDLVTLLMRSPIAPGAPEAAEGAALLANIDPEMEFYPEVRWRRGQLQVLHHATTHSFDELQNAAIDLALSRRLYPDAPVPPEINVALTKAIGELPAKDQTRLRTQVRDEVRKQTLAMAAALTEDLPKYAVGLDLLLQELIARDPSCIEAWEGRVKLCQDENLKPVLEFIVSQFHPDPKKPKPAKREIAQTETWLQQRPYDPERYAIAFNRLVPDSKHRNDRFAIDLYYQAIRVLAPDSLLARQNELVRNDWLKRLGFITPQRPDTPVTFPPKPDAEEEAEILSLAPENMELQLWYLDHLKSRGEYTSLSYNEQVPRLDALLVKHPTSVPVLLRRGRAAQAEVGRSAEALSYFKRAYEVNPDNLDVAEVYGDRLTTNRKYADAVQVFRRLIGPGPILAGDPVCIKFALALTGAGDNSAEQVMGEAMNAEINPEWVQSQLNYIERSPLLSRVTEIMRASAKKPVTR